MALRNKLALLVAAAAMACFIFFHATFLSFITPILEDTETDYGIQTAERLNYTIAERLSNLNTMTSDYAQWDASYEFVHDQNTGYIEENLLDDTFIGLQKCILTVLKADKSKIRAPVWLD